MKACQDPGDSNPACNLLQAQYLEARGTKSHESWVVETERSLRYLVLGSSGLSAHM